MPPVLSNYYLSYLNRWSFTDVMEYLGGLCKFRIKMGTELALILLFAASGMELSEVMVQSVKATYCRFVESCG